MSIPVSTPPPCTPLPSTPPPTPPPTPPSLHLLSLFPLPSLLLKKPLPSFECLLFSFNPCPPPLLKTPLPYYLLFTLCLSPDYTLMTFLQNSCYTIP